MAINRAPWTALVDDSGQNLDGSIWNKAAIKDVLLDPIDALVAPYGVWTATPFAASDYTASAGMTWTVTAPSVVFNRSMLIGKTLWWLVYIEAASLSGTAGPQLFVKFPAPYTGVSKRGVGITAQLYDTTSSRGWIRVNPTGTGVIIEKDPSANFVLQSGATYLEFSLTVEIL
jgi:hypothetical protein